MPIKEKIVNFVSKGAEDWVMNLLKKIYENFSRNILIAGSSLLLIIFASRLLTLMFGRITSTFFVVICIYKIKDIIDRPIRTLVWFFAYALGAVIVSFGFNSVIPSLREMTITSVFIGIGLGAFTILLYEVIRRLKKF